ncbi:MAG: hypothetical protein MO847_02520 [Candidatus Protistobacter heckmanni]|nr:hypothetical protein [Candidatus Protistobacter heckmanni]
MDAREITVVVLLGIPFNDQNYERTGVAHLSRFFNVTVLDCNRWLNPFYASLVYRRNAYEHVIEIDSLQSLEAQLRFLQPGYAIDYILPGDEKRTIRALLTTLGVLSVEKRAGWCPHLSAKELVMHHLAINPISVVLKTLNRLLAPARQAQESLPLPDIALVAGKKAGGPPAVARLSEIQIAADDFHQFWSEKRASPSGARTGAEAPYLLFVDDCIAQAKDYSLLGLPDPIRPDVYYALLNRCFLTAEKVTGRRIVVAAHPDGKAIPNYAENFGGREVVFSRPQALTMNAELILAHGSTALGFAAMNGTPVISLTNKALNASFKGPHIKAMARALGAPLLYMESDISDACRRPRVDQEKYKAYIDDYLRSPESTESQPWEAFTNYLREHSQAARSVPA